MKWFEGNIPEAIQSARSHRSLFVVFITGDEELSSEMNNVLDNDAICQLSLKHNCTALKLEAKSHAGGQFAQIYPVMVIPSIFFISPENGIPLEVSLGQVDVGQLLEKFNRALEMYQSAVPSASSHHDLAETISSETTAAVFAPSDDAVSAHSVGTTSELSTSSDAAVAASSAFSHAAAAATEFLVEVSTDTDLGTATSITVSSDDKASCAVSGAVADADIDNPEDHELEETLEQRQQRLLRTMAERRAQKAQEEEEAAKKREIERRKKGQETQKFRQWKEEMEKKETENSYKKEKEEQKRALEKVRADLERDRQERALKYQQEKEEQEEAKERAKIAKLEAEAKLKEKDTAIKRESSRIQFRLPDGSSVTQVFSATDSLAKAKGFIQQRLNNKPIALSTTYPKRTFFESDMPKTLLDLELVPSCVLIVLPGAPKGYSRQAAADVGNISFLWMLLAPLLALWNFIYNFLFQAPPDRSQENPNISPRNTKDSASTGNSNAQRQPSRSQGLRNRKDGNINRLVADEDDDESATWNGNSTQQM